MMFKTQKERRSFIDNYNEWEKYESFSQLELCVYRAELTTGASIYAVEFSHEDYEGNLRRDAIYSIVMKEGDCFPGSEFYKHFKPAGVGKTMLVHYLNCHPEAEVLHRDKLAPSWYEKLRSMTLPEAAEYYGKGNFEKLMIKVCNTCRKFEGNKEACMQEDCAHCIEAAKKVLLSQYTGVEDDAQKEI